METVITTLAAVVLASSLGGQTTQPASTCEFVKADNGNYLFAADPSCYGLDPIGSVGAEDK